jgi:hypothetical protein
VPPSYKVSLFSKAFFIVTTDDKDGVWLFLSTLRSLLLVKFDKVMVVKCEEKEKGDGEVFLVFPEQKSVKIHTLSSPHLVSISCTSVCPPVTPIKSINRFSLSFMLWSFTKIRQFCSVLVKIKQ